MSSFLVERLHRLRKASDANVTMIYALCAPVLVFGVAMATDFTNASIVRSKLNAAADAAVLAALTPTIMAQNHDAAAAAVTAMFQARTQALGLQLNGYTAPIVTVSADGTNPRVVKLTYQENVNTIFGNVLGRSVMQVGGASTAQASTPPNIDFYLLLDNSPSMVLPASSDGITAMQNLTPFQDNKNTCAFACHQASTNNGDTQGNLCADPDASGGYSAPTVTPSMTYNGKTIYSYCAATNSKKHAITQIDNYKMARVNNITLRLDEVSSGVSTLISTAWDYQSHSAYATPPAYRFAAYQMDSLWAVPGLNGQASTNTQLMPLGTSTSYVTDWSNAASKFGVMQMFSNGSGCSTAACTAGVSNNDQATNFDVALNDMNSRIPAPGNGTNVGSDKPKEVLFWVTDGVSDELNINRLIQPVNGTGGTNYCTTLKNRNVKIAILYTQYFPVPKNAFYTGNVAPIIDKIGPALQACASDGLYANAAIGSDLGAALAKLFQTVVQSATLTN